MLPLMNCEIPKIETGTPKTALTKEQFDYYKGLKENLNAKKVVPIEDNYYYISLYVEDMLVSSEEPNLESVLESLQFLYQAYGKHKTFYYKTVIKFLISDCLLGLKRYEEFLEFSIPNSIYSIVTVDEVDVRLSIQKMLGLQADSLDIYRSQFPRKNKLIESKAKQFESIIQDTFDSYANYKGGWFKIIEGHKDVHKTKFFGFIQTSSLWGNKKPKYDFVVYSYFNILREDFFFVIHGLTTKAINILQNEYNKPNKQVKWRTESLLYRKIKNEFSEIEIVQHGQPDWLGKQHFDIWIPEFNIAIEYQGPQHFKTDYVVKDISKLKELDNRKIDLAKKNNVTLFIVTSQLSDELISDIRKIINDRKNNEYMQNSL